jgi:hypothetical protein
MPCHRAGLPLDALHHLLVKSAIMVGEIIIPEGRIPSLARGRDRGNCPPRRVSGRIFCIQPTILLTTVKIQWKIDHSFAKKKIHWLDENVHVNSATDWSISSVYIPSPEARGDTNS